MEIIKTACNPKLVYTVGACRWFHEFSMYYYSLFLPLWWYFLTRYLLVPRLVWICLIVWRTILQNPFRVKHKTPCLTAIKAHIRELGLAKPILQSLNPMDFMPGKSKTYSGVRHHINVTWTPDLLETWGSFKQCISLFGWRSIRVQMLYLDSTWFYSLKEAVSFTHQIYRHIDQLWPGLWPVTGHLGGFPANNLTVSMAMAAVASFSCWVEGKWIWNIPLFHVNLGSITQADNQFGGTHPVRHPSRYIAFWTIVPIDTNPEKDIEKRDIIIYYRYIYCCKILPARLQLLKESPRKRGLSQKWAWPLRYDWSPVVFSQLQTSLWLEARHAEDSTEIWFLGEMMGEFVSVWFVVLMCEFLPSKCTDLTNFN